MRKFFYARDSFDTALGRAESTVCQSWRTPA